MQIVKLTAYTKRFWFKKWIKGPYSKRIARHLVSGPFSVPSVHFSELCLQSSVFIEILLYRMISLVHVLHCFAKKSTKQSVFTKGNLALMYLLGVWGSTGKFHTCCINRAGTSNSNYKKTQLTLNWLQLHCLYQHEPSRKKMSAYLHNLCNLWKLNYCIIMQSSLLTGHFAPHLAVNTDT